MPLTSAALVKTTLLDYPGEVASIIFTPRCNLRCPYCHNPSLVLNSTNNDDLISIEEIRKFIIKRKNLIGAVVISGGEPLLHDDIGDIVSFIKSHGLMVKIDTNGLYPEKLKTLDVDYIAMDIKTSPEKYYLLGLRGNKDKLKESIAYILESGIDHEFRTTVIEDIIDIDDMEKIIPLLKDSSHWYLTAFQPGDTLDPLYSHKEPPSKEYMESLLSIAVKSGIKSSIK